MRAVTLPMGVGVGFKPQHFDGLMAAAPSIDFIEVHAENYLGAGGLPHRQLQELRSRYALSIHGVGLSIGGSAPIDTRHLQRIADLCRQYEPDAFSEHLAWSTHAGNYYSDLLPLAYTRATLQRVIDHIDVIQNKLRRTILLENPSVYLAVASADMDEVEFLRETARSSGCGLLLDVNNVVVSCTNLATDAELYLQRFALDCVQQIHIAGHNSQVLDDGQVLCIDDHSAPATAATWSLYRHALRWVADCPTLIEWDRDIPELPMLLAEAGKARQFLAMASASSEASSPAQLLQRTWGQYEREH